MNFYPQRSGRYCLANVIPNLPNNIYVLQQQHGEIGNIFLFLPNNMPDYPSGEPNWKYISNFAKQYSPGRHGLQLELHKTKTPRTKYEGYNSKNKQNKLHIRPFTAKHFIFEHAIRLTIHTIRFCLTR